MVLENSSVVVSASPQSGDAGDAHAWPACYADSPASYGDWGGGFGYGDAGVFRMLTLFASPLLSVYRGEILSAMSRRYGEEVWVAEAGQGMSQQITGLAGAGRGDRRPMPVPTWHRREPSQDRLAVPEIAVARCVLVG